MCRLNRWLAGVALFLIAGCGGGGDGGGGGIGGGTPWLQVVDSAPSDGASGVALEVTPTAHFSLALDTSSVTTETFALRDANGPVDGLVTVNGSSATFKPAAALKQATSYELQAKNGIRGLFGSPFAGASLRFTTCDRAWQPPARARATDAWEYSNQVTVDTSGNAVMTWVRYWGWWYYSDVYAVRYDAQRGSWSAPVSLRSRPGIQVVDLAMDAQGNAFAVWMEGLGNRQVWVSRYAASLGTWGAATQVNSGEVFASATASVGVDALGNAVVLWSGQDGSNGSSVWINRFDVGSASWGLQERIATVADPITSNRLAINARGDIAVAWQVGSGTEIGSVWGQQYDSVSRLWRGGVALGAGSGIARMPQVAVDSEGNAFAVWQQQDSASGSIRSARFDAASAAWQASVPLSTGIADGTQAPQIAIDLHGDALVAYRQVNGGSSNIAVSRYGRTAAAWAETLVVRGEAVLGQTPGTVRAPSISVDALGNALLLWTRAPAAGPTNLWSNRYLASNGTWDTGTPIDPTGAAPGGDGQLALSSTGHGLAAWKSGDGIWFSRYVPEAGRPSNAIPYCAAPPPPR